MQSRHHGRNGRHWRCHAAMDGDKLYIDIIETHSLVYTLYKYICIYILYYILYICSMYILVHV